MRGFLIVSAAFLVAGCALPPAVTIASFAADGVSYLTTGKSTTDHAISAIAREDCAILRTLENKAICRPEGEAVAALAEAGPEALVNDENADFVEPGLSQD